jgi:hypothetical protein
MSRTGKYGPGSLTSVFCGVTEYPGTISRRDRRRQDGHNIALRDDPEYRLRHQAGRASAMGNRKPVTKVKLKCLEATESKAVSPLG